MSDNCHVYVKRNSTCSSDGDTDPQKYAIAVPGRIHKFVPYERRGEYQKTCNDWGDVTFAYRKKDNVADDASSGKNSNYWVTVFRYENDSKTVTKDISLATCSHIQKNCNQRYGQKRTDWLAIGDNRRWHEVQRMWVPKVPEFWFLKESSKNSAKFVNTCKKKTIFDKKQMHSVVLINTESKKTSIEERLLSANRMDSDNDELNEKLMASD